MANSSPPSRVNNGGVKTLSNRVSYPWGADLQLNLEELRLEDRNTEESHQRGLEQARRDHANLRRTAIEVLNHYRLQEDQRRVKLEQQQQVERLRAEEALAAERARLHELRAKSIEIPPPPPKEEPAPVKEQGEASGVTSSNEPRPNGVTAQNVDHRPSPTNLGAPAATQPPKPATAVQPAEPNASRPLSNPSTTSSAQVKPPGTQAHPAGPPTTQAPYSQTNVLANGISAASPAQPVVTQQAVKPDRHVEIHKKLKQLRAFMQQQIKSNPQLKSRMGDMRRDIRKSMGQLVEGNLASNKVPLVKIAMSLREALQGGVPCQLVDPNEFVLEPRAPPVDGAQAQNDRPQLPSLFIYLLNIFAKAAIAQFINECGANPKAADPVGTVIAKIFSDVEFQWRGRSMIDILLAKYRVVCPVLFGFRGSDKTEQGRLRLGWWKANGSWISEQIHVDRMTGLAAGFAAIALRDFSKSKSTNPYPPANYWAALARVVNTPANEISDTQCLVLKSMIEHYEQKFIHFYGTAAVAALRVALIEFPAKAPKKLSAVDALPVLAQILKRDAGLTL